MEIFSKINKRGDDYSILESRRILLASAQLFWQCGIVCCLRSDVLGRLDWLTFISDLV